MSLIIPLCSSSNGNSVFAGSRNAGILIDVGCSFRKLRFLLDSCGVEFSAVKAVLITHEHDDHVKGLYQLTRHTEIPVYASEGTIQGLIAENKVSSRTRICDLSELGDAPTDYKINAFATPHDSAESIGFTLEKGDCKIAYCTDLGSITQEVRSGMEGANFVFLESNYEPELLQKNMRYPNYIKNRVASDNGHLSNRDCSEFLTELVEGGATRFILGHLSRENNTPAIARERAARRLAEHGAVYNRDYTLEIAPSETIGEVVAV
ncbi:MAG: MBL fold metallo-hydrolase [Oscillospiraceae bacterium]|nr:MBL fold metallo-hydrolase [Oscillospiraceae bacterium]